ncbi:hypothetical protein AU255_08880 [Methyloprofundus sedimenti]|uniref:YhcG PDDEXK nuclease domain-containing protein n=2 Tax=Methyloprofundus sedimenti TaxID=1420851 RepID=A0A1V8M8W5_9GAMM|nr:hypothetical protein AU255_08880 [Methyloprofundus sedimenti]
MGKGLYPCPSIQRTADDGHVVPPLPILHGIVFLLFYRAPISKEADQPTIGILLCKNKDRLVAEYALSDIQKPIGVSEYQLTQSLPKDLLRRMGKVFYPCPSIQRDIVDGHVVPPLPILHGIVFLLFYHAPVSKEADQPTIGILLCKNKDRLVAEYALSEIQKSLGVSEYQLTQSLPKDLLRRMGKGLYPCPSIQRDMVDGHVVPPLPILHGIVFLLFYRAPISKEVEQPTIGILLCKNKDRLVAEYALSDIQKPIGVSEYHSTQSLPKDLLRRMGKGLYPCPSIQWGGAL